MANEPNVTLIVFIWMFSVLFPEEEEDFDSGFAVECITPEQSRGLCVNLDACAPLAALLQQPSPQKLNYLRRSICGYFNYQPRVCCPVNPPVLSTTTRPPVRPNPPAPVRPVTNRPSPIPSPPRPAPLSVLPARCGITNTTSTRIVGGEEAPLGNST
jgi:Regulatory CLIP domain of proteinases